MRSVLKILIVLFFVVFLSEDSVYAERVFTDSDLQKYGSGSSDSTSGSSNSQGISDAGDENKAIQLYKNAINA